MADEAKEKETQEPSGGGAKRFVPILVLMVIFLGAQVGIAIFISKKLTPVDPKLQALEEEKRLEENERRLATAMGTTMEAPIEVTVNIAETNGERFVVCGIQFEWNAEKHPMMGDELTKRIPKIKDIIINILSTKPLVELQSAEGKRNLTSAILADVNMIFPDDESIGTLTNSYIDKFIIQ